MLVYQRVPFGGFPKWVSQNGGTAIAGWFLMENPNLKWIVTGGAPIVGNHHLGGHVINVPALWMFMLAGGKPRAWSCYFFNRGFGWGGVGQ